MKVMVIEVRTYHQKKYLNKMKPYIRDITIDLQKSDIWKIKLAIATNFVFQKILNKSV